MRLHRLELTAFGPFAGTQTIDLDALVDYFAASSPIAPPPLNRIPLG